MATTGSEGRQELMQSSVSPQERGVVNPHTSFLSELIVLREGGRKRERGEREKVNAGQHYRNTIMVNPLQAAWVKGKAPKVSVMEPPRQAISLPHFPFQLALALLRASKSSKNLTNIMTREILKSFRPLDTSTNHMHTMHARTRTHAHSGTHDIPRKRPSH